MVYDKNYLPKKEFAEILSKFIFPLMPENYTFDEIINKVEICENEEKSYSKFISYNVENGCLDIVSSKKNPLLRVRFIIDSDNSYSFNLAENILQEFMKIAWFNTSYTYKKGLIDKRILSEQSHYYDAIIERAFIVGISKWLCGEERASITFTKILSKIENWKNKKYEGSNVTFGFILDLEKKDQKDYNVDYINFLDSDFSGLFADGISTTVFLNREGRLTKSCIISEEFAFLENQLTEKSKPIKEIIISPKKYFEFAGLISSKKVGIALENNGDILVFKKHSLFLAKRNGKWLFFDNNRIVQKIFSVVNDEISHRNVNDDMILSRCILNIILDAAFERKGACLGIIDNFDNVKEHALKDHINYDDFKNFSYCKEKANQSENEKRINLKKTAIASYIWSDKCSKIQDIPRDIITEILSIDGATIIDKDGNILAVGAILNNIKESSDGGARTLAARALGKIGLGIKISEDGYVVAYINEDNTIKEYFKIK